jgi:hypothetical protein
MGEGVDRDRVIEILGVCRVFVAQRGDGEYALAADGKVPEIKRFPPIIQRKLLGYLAQKFGIPVHLFWQPPAQAREWVAAQADHSKRADPN